MKAPIALLISLALASATGPALGNDARETSAQAPRPVPADDSKAEDEKAAHQVEIMVLHATNSGKGIDPRIGKMPKLKQPPFSSYDSYELLEKKQLPLIKDEPQTMKLPNERILRTSLLEELPKDYLRISASINQPGAKSFLPLLKVRAKVGQRFIVAGQSYKGGILVLVFKVLK